MQERTNYAAVAPQVLETMLGVHEYLQGCGLDKNYDGSRELRLDTIRAIVLANSRAIPFENLNPLLR